MSNGATQEPKESRVKKIGEILDKFLSGAGAMFPPGAPPSIMPAQVGGAAPQLATLPGQIPGLSQPAAPLPPPSTARQVQTPEMVPIPPPSGVGIGQEFGKKSTARGATAYNIISGLTQLANTIQQRQFSRKKSEYEYLLKEYFDARDRGDTQTANEIANDPRMAKLAKAIGAYKPLEVKAPKPQPEIQAAQDFAKKRAAEQGGAQQQQPVASQQAAPQNVPSQSGAITPRVGGPTQEQLHTAAQRVIGQADPELAPALAAMWEAGSVTPGAAPQLLSDMAKANVQYTSDKLVYSHQAALINTRNQFQMQLELMREQARQTHDAFISQAKDENQKRQIDAAFERQTRAIDAAEDRLQRSLDARTSGRPLTQVQRYNIERAKTAGGRLEETINGILNNFDVIRGFWSSMKAKYAGSSIGRFTPASDKEKAIAADFKRIPEQIQQLRGPYGGTGFRGGYAWTALQDLAAQGKFWENPDVTYRLLTDALEDIKQLNTDADEALAGSQAGGPARQPMTDDEIKRLAQEIGKAK